MKNTTTLLLLALAGCHETPASKASAWDQIDQQIRPDGTLALGASLAAFTLAFGPLPDVPTPPGAVTPTPCATEALWGVYAHEAELTGSQQKTVQALSHPAPSTDPALQAKFAALVDTASTSIAANLHIEKMSINVVVNSTEVTTTSGEAALAYTEPLDAKGGKIGPLATCTIYFNPSVTLSDSDTIQAVTHETFHCYEADLITDMQAMWALPRWFSDGAAQWVTATLTGGVDRPLSATTEQPGWSWGKCLTQPSTSLYQRSYDGLCFFGEMAEQGRSPWDHFARMLVAFSVSLDPNHDAFLEGSGGEDFFDQWATSVFRKPAFGAEWDIEGPGITDDEVTPFIILVPNDSTSQRSLPPASTDAYVVSLSADVVVLDTPPHSTLHSTDSSGFATASPSGIWCTRSDGCPCPADSDEAGSMLPSLPAGIYDLAVSGGVDGGQFQSNGLSLDDYCQSPTVDPCLLHRWTLASVDASFWPPPDCTVPSPWGVTFTFSSDGKLVIDLSMAGAINCVDEYGLTILLRLSGQDTGDFKAAHGLMVVSNGTASDTGDVTFNGVDVGNLFSFTDTSSGPVTTRYECHGSQLSLITSTSPSVINMLTR